MSKNLDLRYIFSYLGVLPYLILLIDKSFLNQIQINIINDFYIYYSLIIIVFIGAINWSLKEEISTFLVLYGLLPSVIGIVIIILQLFYFDYFFVALILIIFILFQLLLDNYYIYNLNKHKIIFFKLRLPLSLLICFCLIINLVEF